MLSGEFEEYLYEISFKVDQYVPVSMLFQERMCKNAGQAG